MHRDCVASKHFYSRNPLPFGQRDLFAAETTDGSAISRLIF
jgi:hypothetical protein